MSAEKTYAHIIREKSTGDPEYALIRAGKDRHPVLYRLESVGEDEHAALLDNAKES